MTPAQSFQCIDKLCQIILDCSVVDHRERNNFVTIMAQHIQNIHDHPEATLSDIKRCQQIIRHLHKVVDKELELYALALQLNKEKGNA